MDELSDDELLEALGVVVETKKPGAHTQREERVLAGFEDIINFVKKHGRARQHCEERDIFRATLRCPPGSPARAAGISRPPRAA